MFPLFMSPGSTRMGPWIQFTLQPAAAFRKGLHAGGPIFQKVLHAGRLYLNAKMPEWRKSYPGIETLSVAVMGCIVNGPGESKHADIGISLPGTGESPAAPVFIDGRKAATLRGPTLAEDFMAMVEEYIEKRFGQASQKSTRVIYASE